MSSSGGRGTATSKGGKGAKADKSHKTDTGGKGSGGGGDKVHNNKENQPLLTKNEELTIKEKVKQLMELTCRSEDEVCLALHESDNDINQAINLLYEEPSTGEWETKDKKKKKRQTSASKTTEKKIGDDVGLDDWDDSVPPMAIQSGAGGDGKDWKERGGRARSRGPRGTDRRGRGRGRGGGRYQPRGGRGGYNQRQQQQQPIDTWDSANNTWDNSVPPPPPPAADDWDDLHTDEWSTEEYTGSLVETKVFTPSVQTPGGGDVFASAAVAADPPPPPTAQLDPVTVSADTSYSQTYSPQQPSPVPPMVGTLTAAQTQYFSQLSQQNSDTRGTTATYQTPLDTKSNQSYSTAAAQSYNSQQESYYPTSYGGTTSQDNVTPAQQPKTTTQRARVPPPSKIPASAVEMPGDVNSTSITYLDVQFGAMDLDFDTSDVKYDSQTTESSSNVSAQQQQPVTATNNNNEHLTYSSTKSGGGAQAVQAQVEMSNKSGESYGGTQGGATYNSYGGAKGSGAYNAYGTTQTTSSYTPSATSYVTNQATSYASSGVATPSTNNSYAANSYSTTAAAAVAAQQANQVYQQKASAYPASVTQSNNSYQSNNPSVYGTNTGLNSSSNYSSAQYNNYNKLKDNSSTYDVPSSSTTTSSGKSTAKNSTSVMSGGMPPGVTSAVMNPQYIVGQVPYFQQPVYSYEDMQLLQQRLPHMTTSYYDMGYQTPTTLATVRGDPTAATLAGYGAATGDARFQTAGSGRTGDGTTSPVSAAPTQQQQAPILAAAAPGAATPYFFAAAPYNTMGAPPSYAQFYTQLPTVTNASNQYGPKAATYGSTAYGAYDAQDYTKAVAVAAAAVAAQKGQSGNSSSASGGSGATNDLMYAKKNSPLGKVSSYEKQGFIAGTPPPFTANPFHNSPYGGGTPPPFAAGAHHQSQVMAAAAAQGGTGYSPQQVYIPTMPQHHSQMAAAMQQQQPLHQDSNSGVGVGQRSQVSNQQQQQTKTGGAKQQQQQGYGASYWNQN